MTRRILASLIFLWVLPVNSAMAKVQWYKCIVKASSHTGYYTFKIDAEKCQVYWLEIDTQLKIQSCKLPVIKGLKPSAMDDLSVVMINVKTGYFYDYLSGVLDRGWCKPIAKP